MLGTLGALLLAGLALLLLWRVAADRLVDHTLKRLMKEPYTANLWELIAGFGHNPLLPTMENELRAQDGKVLHRPIGTPRRFPHLEGLVFNPAQLHRPPRAHDAAVAMAVTLGPRARRPLTLEMPLLVSAMGYGVAISDRVAEALARGTATAGTACNAGHGPLLPEVRRAARHLIIQYTGNAWTHQKDVLKAADMIEIRLGQGAWGAMGSLLPARRLTERSRKLMGARPGEDVVLPSQIEGLEQGTRALRRLVRRLRIGTGGVPIGVKLAMTHDLEAELDMVLAAGVDVIALDGAQGGTHESPPILADDFGLPTLYGLVRAVRHLERLGARGQVSLIVGGGLGRPGDYLKCLALGADAVYVGTSALFAAAHTQVSKVLPWEPPTELIYDKGSLSGRFDVAAGAHSLANFLKASAEEMAVGVRALGKDALAEVGRSDLVALDDETARLTGLPVAGETPGGRR